MSDYRKDETASWDTWQVREAAAHREENHPQTYRHRRRRRRNPVLAVGGYLVCVLVLSALLAGVGWMLGSDLCAFNRGALTTATIEVTADDTVATVADKLQDAGLIKYKWFFKLFAGLAHADKKIGIGTYELNTEMDYRALILGMHNASGNMTAETVTVTIPEGYTVMQTIRLLAEKGVNTEENLLEAAKTATYDYSFIDNKSEDISRLEGYLFPDTYEVYKGNAAVVDTINKMLNNFGNKYDADIKSGAENLGRSMHDIVTIASLVEREAQRDDERARIAGVIYNRLNNSSEFPYLQVDASVLYGLGRTGGKLSDEDLKSDSEYNLYNHKGLPPGPICNPGYASLYAASHPEDNNYYYYVAMPDGSHLFASSYEEHERNIEASNQAQAQAASDIAVKFLSGEKVDAVNMVNYEKVTKDNAQEILDMLK